MALASPSQITNDLLNTIDDSTPQNSLMDIPIQSPTDIYGNYLSSFNKNFIILNMFVYIYIYNFRCDISRSITYDVYIKLIKYATYSNWFGPIIFLRFNSNLSSI